MADQELSVRMKADGSGLVGEVRTGAAEVDKLGRSAEQAGARIETMNAQQRAATTGGREFTTGMKLNAEATAKLEDELVNMLSRLGPQQNAMKQLVTGQDLLTRSYNAGLISAEGHDNVLKRLVEKYGPAAEGAEKVGRAHEAMGGHSRTATREVVSLFRSLESGNMEHAAIEAARLGIHVGGVGMSAVLAAGGIATLGLILGELVAHGERSTRALNDVEMHLAATGRRGLEGRESIKGYIDDLARLPGVTRATAQETVSAIAAVPSIGAPLFRGLTDIVQDFAVATGQKTPAAAKQLAESFREPAKGAQTLNTALSFLTAGQLLTIQSLERQGRVMEAQQALYDALKGRIKGLHEEGLTPMQRATNALGNSWDNAMEHMADSSSITAATRAVLGLVQAAGWLVEKAPTAAAAAVKLMSFLPVVGPTIATRQITEYLRSRSEGRPSGGASGSWGDGTPGESAGASADVTEQIRRAVALGQSYEGTARKAQELRDTEMQLSAALTAAKTAGDAKAYDALTLALAGVRREMAQLADTSALVKERAQTQFNIEKDALDRGRNYLEQNYKLQLVSFIEYTEAKKALALAAVDAEEARLRKELGIAQMALGRAQPGRETAAARANVESVQARIDLLPGQRNDAQRAYDVAWGERKLDNSQRQTAGAQEFRSEQQRADAELEASRQQQSKAFMASDNEYRVSTRQAEIAAMTDSRARTLAQFDFERAERQRRIGETTNDVGERQRLEKDLASWTVARQAQLAQELKPEWQKMVDNWSDSTRLMRDSVNSVTMASVRAGEDMAVQWRRTGHLSGKAMGDAFLDEWMRALYRASIARPIAEASAASTGSMLGFLGLGGSQSSPSGSGTPTRAPVEEAVRTPVAAFANGGVMTGGGPMPLKKYANGGIADSPQTALFGEGSSPEAFVPLPDGRSIPVSFQGGGGAGGGGSNVRSSSVTVNAPLNLTIDARGAAPGTEQRLMSMLQQSMPGVLYQHRGLIAGLVSGKQRESGRR